MRHQRVIAALSTLAAAVALGALAPVLAAGATVVQSASPLAVASNAVEATPASSPVEFSVGLKLGDQAGAESLASSVSRPGSPSYRRFLTPAQWEQRFSPSQPSVDAVTGWLRSQGITVDGVTPDRMTVQATGTAAAVQRAFATSLGEYRQHGKVLRLASSALTVPAGVSALIAGVTGIDETPATPDNVGREAASPAGRSPAPAKKGKEEIPQPEGFRNGTPCSSAYAEKLDTIDPAFGAGYPFPLPYAPCGYVPPQLQSAYGLSGPISEGIDGRGVRVAIVDAFVSPTLFADAQQYSRVNQSSQVLRPGQFSELLSRSFNHTEVCEASGWFGEQTLDVEAVHATAPGAKLLYVGAKNCVGGLFEAVQQVVDGHLADVITNSWGDNGGDVLDSAGTRRSFDNVLLMAIATGIGVQFSSGDEGDEFANLGMTVADYPPSSPYQTAVGGTSLQVNAAGQRAGELGWSTSKSVLCTTLLAQAGACKKGQVGKYVPPAPGAYLYGSGGGTSLQYPEPAYQENVVPKVLTERNSKITGIRNRVEPDISMNADPTTGMLVGETQTFPDGVYYDQYRIGGTSLSSPLFAGEMALADQAAGGPLGFVNPLLYELAAKPGTAFYDVVPAGPQADVRVDYLNGVDAKEGTITSVRTLDYQGKEKFCSGTGSCTTQKVAIETAPGFDSMTGIGSPGNGLIAALAKP
jgi:subtilase family serine protease